MCNFVQVFLKYLLWQLSITQIELLDWFAIGSALWFIVTDASAKIVLTTEYSEGGMIYSVDLLSDDHHTHILCHTHGDIIDVEGDLLAH